MYTSVHLNIYMYNKMIHGTFFTNFPEILHLIMYVRDFDYPLRGFWQPQHFYQGDYEHNVISV